MSTQIKFIRNIKRLRLLRYLFEKQLNVLICALTCSITIRFVDSVRLTRSCSAVKGWYFIFSVGFHSCYENPTSLDNHYLPTAY